MILAMIEKVVGMWVCGDCQKMHRRAQAAESAAAKVIRQNDHARLWRTVDHLRMRSNRHLDMAILRGKRYRAEVEKISASGLVDTVHPGSGLQTGYLCVLVDRLIERASRTGGVSDG